MIDLDKFDQPKGYMRIDAYDENDQLIDSQEDCNLVMNNARGSMQALIGGISSNYAVNRFYLGTKGVQMTGGLPQHVSPKTPGSGDNQYHPSRTNLFQDDSGQGGHVFEARFNNTSTQSGVSKTATAQRLRTSQQSWNSALADASDMCTMTRTLNDRTITFEITIPKNQANSNTGYLEYSEQALYCDDKIFSMKTFPTKFKDENVKLIVTWSIIF